MIRSVLPSPSKKDLVRETMIAHRLAAESELWGKAKSWSKIHWFMHGFRDIAIQTMDGVPPADVRTTTDSERRIQLEVGLQVFQTELGRLLQLDWAPASIRKTGLTLDDIRKTAVAQVFYDNFWDNFRNEDFLLGLLGGVLTYGTMGVAAFSVPGEDYGSLGACLTTIPPWELLSFPAGLTGLEQVAGPTWRTWVPYDWVRESFKGLDFPSNERDLCLREVEYGERLHVENSPALSFALGTGVHGVGGSYRSEDPNRNTTNKKKQKVGLLSQTWLQADDGTALRYLVMMGDAVILDKVFTERDPANRLVVPVGVARYLTVPGFYGRSLMDRIVPLNREIERALGNMLKNMQDMDYMRCLAVPVGGVNLRMLKSYMRDKILPYSPDPSNGGAPTILSPPNIGDAHGKTVNMLTGLLQGLAGQGEMFRGDVPGRLEATSGLGFLAEQQSVPLAPVTKSIVGGLRQPYKALLNIFRETVGEAGTNLRLNVIDESMVGVKFDPSSGSVVIDKTSIPHPHEIRVGIRNEKPRSDTARKALLDDQLQKGACSIVMYKIAIQKEGIDTPVVDRGTYYDYQTAWLENIIIFNDGKTPGSLKNGANEFADGHHIHQFVHTSFVKSWIVRAASPEVRDALIRHIKLYHQPRTGPIPAGIEGIPDVVQGLADMPAPLRDVAAQTMGPGPQGEEARALYM